MIGYSWIKSKYRLHLLVATLPAVALIAGAFLQDAAHHASQRSATVGDHARLAAGTVDVQLGKLLELTKFCAASSDLLDRVDLAAVAESCGRYATIIGASVEVVVTGDTRHPILNTRADAPSELLAYRADQEPEELLALEAKSRETGRAYVSDVYTGRVYPTWTVTAGQALRLADGRNAMVHVNLPAGVLSDHLAALAGAGDPLIGLIDHGRRIVARSVPVDRPLFSSISPHFRDLMEAGVAGSTLNTPAPEHVGETWDVGYFPLSVTPGWMTVAVLQVPDGLGSWALVSLPSAMVLAGFLLSGALLWFVVYRDRMKSGMAAAERARAEADRSNKEKSRLLASFAHDIRSPLISLIGSLELLEIGASHGSRGISTARGTAETLLQMVDDILELSFLGSGAFRLNPSPVDLRRLAADLVDQSRRLAEEKGLSLRLEIDGVLPAAVEVDRLRLQQVLGNLLTNAVKYTERGIVVVRIAGGYDDEGRAELTFAVADTGVGVSEEDIPKILREFGRLDREVERQVQGAGLGLAIVQRILRAMGAQLTIKSAPAQGSVFGFTLTLPVLSALPAEDETAPLAGLTIVYAEDEPVIRMVTSRRLSAAGARVIEAVDGIDTLEQLRETSPDLLVIDLHMPRLDGVGVIRTLSRSVPPAFPVFVLTAHIAGPEADAAAAAGATEVFTKPIQIEALAAAYRAWCSAGGRSGPSGASGPPAPNHPLDAETFRAVFTVADASFGMKLLGIFRSDMRSNIAGLVAAVAAGDAAKARSLSHRGLGICQVLGAVRLGKMLSAIEEAAAIGDLGSITQLAQGCAEVLESTIGEMEDVAGGSAL
jgi:signal transduction histidine kinase/CheY-like chemotaxis protein/HPt (histidine-containing phosphotransfer) domain-containing protein